MKFIKRSFLSVLALIVAIGLLAGLIRIREMVNNKPLFGSLQMQKEIPGFKHATDNFTFVWDADALQLLIYHRSQPDKVQWASIPGESFLHASLGSEEFSETRGSYFIRNKIRKRFTIQRIDDMKSSSGGLAITGKLTGDRNRTAVAFELAFEELDDRTLSFRGSTDSEVNNNRLYLTYATHAGEQFFGFGTQYSHFNLKGRRVPVLVSEQGIGRGAQPLTFLVDLVARSGGKWYTSYAPVPYYMTSDMRSLYLASYEYSVFDLRKRNKVQLTVLSNEIDGRILVADSPAGILELYTGHTGRMPALPDWINNGAVVGMQGGTEKVYEVWSALRSADVPVAAFWLQDWVGQRTTSFGKQLWWNWTLDQEHYYDWDKLITDLHKDSIRVMGYINPYLADISEKGGTERDLLREAREKDLLVKNMAGEVIMVQITSFSAAILDLSKPTAREWVKEIIREEMLSIGLSGWMADFGEALPMDAELGNIDAKSYHNRYPEVWSAVNADAAEADSTGEIVYFSRSGYTRSPGVNRLFWLGDQMTAWDRHDGIKTAVTGLLSSGISGFSLNHSDIGGYTAITDRPLHIVREKELLLRWIELNAFTAVFRSHEGNRPDVNAQLYSDAETIAQFARFAGIYQRLAPYRSALMEEAAATGMPVVRHPFLHYWEDKVFHSMSFEQFMLGPDIMVCPVLDKGKTNVQAYLPAGIWHRAFSGGQFESAGQYFEVDAPVGQPAVFYKEGSTAAAYLK
jgi:alpha-glucosidase